LSFDFSLYERKIEEQKIMRYHAAVYPEPACPELVEGSKGRLKPPQANATGQ